MPVNNINAAIDQVITLPKDFESPSMLKSIMLIEAAMLCKYLSKNFRPTTSPGQYWTILQ